MSIRITNNMIIQRTMRNQNSNLYNLNKVSEDIDSMVNLHRPSDDPVKVSRVLRLESDISLNVQYQENIKMAESWYSITDASLKEVNDVLQRARELAVEGASGTFSQEDKQKMEEEIKNLKEHLITVANQTYTGRHIFSGFKTDVALLNANGEYNAAGGIDHTTLSSESITLKIGVSQQMGISTPGTKIFGDEVDTPNPLYDPANTTPPMEPEFIKKPQLIAVVEKLMKNLHDGNSAEVSKDIESLDTEMKRLLAMRGEVGAKVRTTELISERMDDDNLNLRKLLSMTRDTNMSEAYTKLTTQESIYRASLAVSARIMQPTLIDFLR